jgi:hypothetical protein
MSTVNTMAMAVEGVAEFWTMMVALFGLAWYIGSGRH